MSIATLPEKAIHWSPRLVKRLRGNRTIDELAISIGVESEIISLWESGQLEPDAWHAARLSDFAEQEGFLKEWRLSGSGVLLGDLETASVNLSDDLRLLLTARMQRLME